jgi:hypothetical protein
VSWTAEEEGRRWTLDAAPRYAVERRNPYDYRMLIDGHEVDSACLLETAFSLLVTRFEYEEHGAELALARTRLRQARERLLDRFPHAARDGQLSSILEGLGDALGTGPELDVSAAQPRSAEPGLFAQQVSPELVVGTDSSQCIVLLVGGTGPKDPIRKVIVTDVLALIRALSLAMTAQATAMAEAWKQRQAGPDEKRCSEGKLTKREAVEWLVAREFSRQQAVRAVGRLQDGAVGGPFTDGMIYDGRYWVVPVTPESGD